MKQIHYNADLKQWELEGKKITFETARKYWNQEGRRKAAWSERAYRVMCEIR